MKSQILFTTLSMAATLATVDSFHIPMGNSPSRPSSSLSFSVQEDSSDDSSSDGFGLRKMSKDLMQQKKEEDTTGNPITGGYMSFASSGRATPKPLKMSTWKKEDAKKEELAQLEFVFEKSIGLFEDGVNDIEGSWQ